MDKLLSISFFSGYVSVYIGLLILIVAGFIFLTMWLWNWLMPELFLLPTINFYQAAGLLTLTKLLFYTKS